MAESICKADLSQANPIAKLSQIKNKIPCALNGNKSGNGIPIFSPEGFEGAKDHVNTYHQGCEATKGPLSVFGIYGIKCPEK